MKLDEIFSLYYNNKIQKAKEVVEQHLEKEDHFEFKLLKALIDQKIGGIEELASFLQSNSPELHYLTNDQVFKLSVIHANNHLTKHEYEEFRYYLDKATEVYKVFENIWNMGPYVPEYFRMQAHWEIMNGHNQKAVLILETCIQINQALGNLSGLGSNHYLLGSIHSEQGYLDDSLNHYLEAITIFNKLDDDYSIVNCYNDVGNILHETGNPSHALDFYDHALTKTEQDARLEILKPKILNNIGHIAYVQGKLREAMNYFLNSKQILQEYGDYHGLARVFLNLGRIIRAQGDLETALDYFYRAKEYEVDLLQSLDQIMIYYELVLTYCKLGRIADARRIVNEITKLTMARTDEQSLHILTFAKAMVMKCNPNVAFHLSARNVFLNLYEEQSLKYEIRIESLLQVIELDLDSTDQFIPSNRLKLLDLLNMLHKISQENSLIFYLVQVLLIKAKLAYLKEDHHQAELLAVQAEILAKEHGMNELVKDISSNSWDQVLNINSHFTIKDLIRGELSELIARAL